MPDHGNESKLVLYGSPWSIIATYTILSGFSLYLSYYPAHLHAVVKNVLSNRRHTNDGFLARGLILADR